MTIHLECSLERPWGVHQSVRNDGDCPRCGWTAPGPRSDAVADGLAAAAELEAVARLAEWVGTADASAALAA